MIPSVHMLGSGRAGGNRDYLLEAGSLSEVTN